MPADIGVLTFTGWARVPDALDCVLPDEIRDVRHMFYHSLKGVDEVLEQLQDQPVQPDVVVGWSMGGRLATHMVAQRVVKPKLLVLISTQPRSVENLHNAFKASPDRFRAKFFDRMLEGDINRDKMRARFWLQTDDAYDKDWLHWIGTSFNCDRLDFSNMPRTLIIHGENDVVVPPEQAKFFGTLIKNSRLEILPGCGHAPHMHDTKRVKSLIQEELLACGLLVDAKESA